MLLVRARRRRLRGRLDDAAGPDPGRLHGPRRELAQRGMHIDARRLRRRRLHGPHADPDRDLDSTRPGLDQATTVRLYLYIFRDRDAFERLRATVDACARSYVTDPETFESIDQSPFVLAGQGPWGQQFEAALRAGLLKAAGNGGTGGGGRARPDPARTATAPVRAGAVRTVACGPVRSVPVVLPMADGTTG